MKTIILTASATLAIFALSVLLFFKSLLSLFGLAALPLEKIQELHTAQSVVEQMKSRHQDKKATVGKKFAKRTSKRIATSAVAAATVGTLAVTAVIAASEVEDYCSEKESLQQEANLLFGTNLTFSRDDCLAEAQRDAATIINDLKNSSGEAVAGVLHSANSLTKNALNTLQSKARELLE